MSVLQVSKPKCPVIGKPVVGTRVASAPRIQPGHGRQQLRQDNNVSISQALPLSPTKSEHSLSIAGADFDFLVFLPIPLEGWDHKSTPSYLFLAVLWSNSQLCTC